jgi:hypothetical protein
MTPPGAGVRGTGMPQGPSGRLPLRPGIGSLPRTGIRR